MEPFFRMTANFLLLASQKSWRLKKMPAFWWSATKMGRPICVLRSPSSYGFRTPRAPRLATTWTVANDSAFGLEAALLKRKKNSDIVLMVSIFVHFLFLPCLKFPHLRSSSSHSHREEANYAQGRPPVFVRQVSYCHRHACRFLAPH